MRAGTAKLTSKGQFTLPLEVRQALGVKPGDTIEFFVHRTGDVMIIPRNRAAAAIIGRAARATVPLVDTDREAMIAEAILDRGAPDRLKKTG